MKNQSIKVLVVDDEEQIRGLFCTVLRSAGYVVRAATDGLTAIRHMEDTRFDIVVTDVCMPRMDGLELLAEVRDRWPESRVVVHSSMLTERVSRLARLEGAYACLPKSHDIAQLLKIVASASSAA